MNKEELFGVFGIRDMNDLPQAVSELLAGDTAKRNCTYKELLRLNGYDLSRDWFQPLYEQELAERRQKKQDFTPPELGTLCSRLTAGRGTLHEPTAGNGSMVIADW